MSAATLFTGIGHLITMEGASKKEGKFLKEEDLSIIEDAAILESQGQISWVGTLKDAKSQGLDKTPNALQKALNVQTLLPAFIECHTHSIFAGNRSGEIELRLQGLSYLEISKRGGGIGSTVKATRQASDQELKELLKERLTNFRRQGVSVVEVKTGYGLNVDQELRLLRLIKELGDDLVLTTFLGPHSLSPDFDSLDKYMDDICDKALPMIKKENLSQRVDIFIESGFYSLEQAKRYFSKAKSLGFQVTAHVDQLSHTGGVGEALGVQSLSVDHCVHSSDKDINALAASNTTAVLLPSSDFYLDIDYPPARKMLDGGVRVALSTDFNPGTSPSQSLELVSVLARVKMKMRLFEVLSAWTVGPSYALGMEKSRGSLEVGKQCDFVSFDRHWSSLFYEIGNTKIKELVLNGKTVAFPQ